MQTTHKHRESVAQKIRKLIQSGKYRTQDEVVVALRKQGMVVTQSSVSRALRDLDVSKVGGVYVLMQHQALSEEGVGNLGIGSLITKITPAGANLLVVQTARGSANVVAEVFDRLPIPGVVGTVAGDDTIFVATKGRAGQESAIVALKTL